MDDASRVLVIACMLIASRHDGKVPDDPDYVKRVAYLNKKPDFKPLVNIGFLVPDSAMLAPCKRDASTILANARPETETETYTETEERQNIVRFDGAAFDAFWKAYPRKVGKGAALTAWKKHSLDSKLPEILAAVKVQSGSQQWKKDAGQYIPNPATWLNQSRWEDELAPVHDARGITYNDPDDDGSDQVIRCE